MAIDQRYYPLWFESFRLKNRSGHRDPVQLKLVGGQRLPREIEVECDARGGNAFELLTECIRKLFNDFPVGTRFRLKVKLTDHQGSGMFFYTYFGWKPLEVVMPS